MAENSPCEGRKSGTEKPPIPWNIILLGIVVQAIFIMFLFGYRCFYYVRGLTYTWTENYFDFGIYLLVALIIVSILTKIGRKANPNTLAILFTFFNISYPLTHLITRGPTLAAIIPYANKWAMEANLIPSWWVLSPEEAERMYLGGFINWSEWVIPISFWTVHYVSVLMMCLFLMAIWRRQWIEVEKLPFPHAMPIIDIVSLGTGREKESIFEAKPLWYGLIVAIVLYIWDPLRMLSGGLVPRLPLYTIHYAEWVGAPSVSLLPQTKGLILLAFSLDHLMAAYILPLDIIFSVWISMFIFHWIKPILGIHMGIYPDISGEGWWPFYLNNGWFFWPPNMTLGWGMWVGIALWCFWTGRDHIRNIVNVLLGKSSAVDDPVLSYKISVPGFIVFALIWIVTMLISGATPITTIAFSIFFILIFQALGRMKGEFWTGGRPVRLGGSVGWLARTYYYFPTETYDQPDAQVFAAFFENIYGNTVDAQAGFPPRSLDALKVTNGVGGVGRDVVITAIISIVFGVIFATFFRIIWAYNVWGHTYGWGGNEGGGLAKTLFEGIYSEGGAYAGGVDIYSLGAAIAIILFILKARFYWWPINPIGFAAPMNFWVMPWLFLTFFFAWLWKYLTLKIGGAPLHRKMLRFAYGFIAGYFAVNIVEWFIITFVVGPGARPPPV